MSIEDEVRIASKRFYEALNRMANGDSGPLGEVWSHGAEVTAMHPIGGRQVGWDAVRQSFEQVARSASDGHLELQDQLLNVSGDVAYELGVERGRFELAGRPVAVDVRVTNIYRRRAGEWRMIHHHTDASPAMLEALERLQRSS